MTGLDEDLNAEWLGTLLRERVSDHHPDLTRRASAALRTGTRMKRRRRLAQTTGAVAVFAGLGLLGASLLPADNSPGSTGVSIRPAPQPSALLPIPPVRSVALGDSTHTDDGIVIVSQADKICVGDAIGEPSCLVGSDVSLSTGSGYSFSDYDDPSNVVYAWLVPVESVAASLTIGDDAPIAATLFRLEGRDVTVAALSGIQCWTDATRSEQVAVDAEGKVTSSRSLERTICP